MPRKRTPKPALTGNAADEQQVENAKREESNREVDEQNDLYSLLALPHFRRFAWRVLDYAGPFRSPLGPDDRYTNFNVGRSDVGRWLLKAITDANPDALTQMMQEYGSHA